MPIPYGPLPAIALLDPPIPDGDPSVAPSFKELANVRAYARGGLWGQLVGGEWYEVDPASTAAAPVIQLAEISAIALKSPSGVWMTFYTTGTTIGAAEIEGGGPLAPSSWYYLYAYFDGALLQAQFQISLTPPTTAPQPSRLRSFKRGEDGNYRYIGSFRTGPAGDPIPMRFERGRATYTLSAAFPLPSFVVIGGGAAPVPLTALLLAPGGAGTPLLPPHARVASLRWSLTDVVGARLSLQTNAADLAPTLFPPTDVTRAFLDADIVCDATQTIRWQNGGGGSVMDDVVMSLVGWRE